MENLNAEQIIKALECWASDNPCIGSACAVYRASTESCDRWIGERALALIKSQELRIKELTEDVEWSAKRILDSDKRINNQREELRRLNNHARDIEQSRNVWKEKATRLGKQLHEEIEQKQVIKADTVKKMLDSLSLHFGTYTDEDTVKVVEVFKLLERVGREILEGDKGR